MKGRSIAVVIIRAPDGWALFALVVFSLHFALMIHGRAQTLPPIPMGHPRILLIGAELQRLQSDYANAAPAFMRFKTQMVDLQIAGADIYAYQPWYSALVGVVIGNPSYCTHAIQMTDDFLDDEAERIHDGEYPLARADSYLEIGDAVGNVALVYDWCYSQLSVTQRLRWGNYADTFTDNVWHQATNHWGEPTAENNYSWDGTPKPPGSEWSVNNPVNNYYYSFLRATMLWGLASRHEAGRTKSDEFLSKFRFEKLQDQLVPVFNAQLAGGGSREGTGYGTAMKGLFGLYYLWEKTTGERIAGLTSHTQASMPYQLHMVSPTRARLAPIGDHARDSAAEFYDYHRESTLALAALNRGTGIARSMRDFLAFSSRPQMGDRFNWVWDAIYNGTETVAAQQVNTSYYAPGTGHFFTRSGWETTATWLTYLTGAFTESHAHPDGLSLLLFKNGWLVYDANIDSHSGLQNTQEAHALVVQRRADGTIIPMWGVEADPTADPPRPESSAHLRAMAERPEYIYVSSDQGTLFNHPHTGNPGVRAEREIVYVRPNTVIVFDRSQYTPGSSTKTFQLPTPGLPTISSRTATYNNGASSLKLFALAPTNSVVAITSMTTVDSDFNAGYRIDSRVTTTPLTHFMNVLSVDNAVNTAVRGADDGNATVTLADGRVITLNFNLQTPGGAIEIRNGQNQVLVSETLPTTIVAPNTFLTASRRRLGQVISQ